MRYMILVKASAESEAGALPSEEMLAKMAAYHEDLQKAGVLVDGNGLMASSHGWRIRWTDGGKVVTDGPFAETKELVAGYTIINVASEAEARDWASRFPNPSWPAEGAVEVRRMFELEDFGQSETLERFREMDMSQGKR